MEEPIAFVWWLWYFLLHNVVSWALFQGKKKKSFVPFTTLLFSSPRCKKLPLKQLSYTQSFYLFLQGAIQLAHHKIILKIIPSKKSASLWSTFNRLWRFIFGQKLWYEVQYYWEHLEEHIWNMRNMLGPSLRTCWGTHWEHGEKTKMQKNQIPHKHPPLTWAV